MQITHLSLTTFIAVAALSVSSPAFAHGKMHMKGKAGMHRIMFQMMDSNKDGSISGKEFQAFRDGFFSKADKNKDGKLTTKEFSQIPKMMKEMRKKVMEIAKKAHVKKKFIKLDANHDGKISKAEYDAKGDRSFIRMDKNDDGLLNKKDRKRMMQKMGKMGRMGKN